MQIVERGGAYVIKCATILPADATLRPLFDYIILEPLASKMSDWVAIVQAMRPLHGKVLAIGPGVYPKRYNHPEKHKRTKMWYSRRFQPTTVQVGDIVQLGGMNYGGYDFEGFYWGSKFCLVCREADVVGIENASAAA